MSYTGRTNCHRFQEKMAQKRDREFQHQQFWNEQVDYYERNQRSNAKFDEWTSPRYYESNVEKVEKMKKEKDKKETLEKRREELKTLLDEDQASHEIEMMMRKAKDLGKERESTGFEGIPDEVLKDINLGLKVEQEERKRKEAELKLYQQWRRDNPVLRETERNTATKDIKLSWLDQQIDKRMAKEKEQEECKRFLKERDENIQRRKEEEEVISEEIKKKNLQLQEDLLKQIEELNLKHKESEDLQKIEAENLKKRHEVLDLQDKFQQIETLKRNKEIVVYNLKHHKLKLQMLSKQTQENLIQQQALVSEIIKSNVSDHIEHERSKHEVKRALDEFLKFSREQKELEKRREDHLNFLFDSEAKATFERQTQIWENEAKSRKELLNDVLSTIEQQIQDNIEKAREKQKELVNERERMLEGIEAYEKQMETNRLMEEEKKDQYKRDLDQQIREKKAKEKKLKEIEKKKDDADLENLRKEEERIKKEIIKIQNHHLPMNYMRKKRMF